MIGAKHLDARAILVAMNFSDLQSADAQQAANGVFNLQHGADKAFPARQHCAHQLQFFAFDVNFFEVADTHHCGDAMRIRAVGLIRPCREKALGVTRFKTESPVAGADERSM